MMYIVHRTQLYIDHDLYRALTALATARGETLSHVIRERLRRNLESERFADPLRTIEQATGLWADRRDLPDTESYVRGLRHDSHRRRRGKEASKDRRR
jgi:hypothetical protein